MTCPECFSIQDENAADFCCVCYESHRLLPKHKLVTVNFIQNALHGRFHALFHQQKNTSCFIGQCSILNQSWNSILEEKIVQCKKTNTTSLFSTLMIFCVCVIGFHAALLTKPQAS